MVDDTTPELTATTLPATAEASGDQRFSISRTGRRQAIVLLVGVATIWVFALWSLITILQDGIDGVEWVSSILMLAILVVSPLVGWSLLEEANAHYTTGDGGLAYSSLAGVHLSLPWSEFSGFEPSNRRGKIGRFFLGDTEEDAPEARPATAALPDNEDDLTAREVEAPPTPESDYAEEPETAVLLTKKEVTAAIANPVVRYLHRLAHGTAIPIHPGVENRSALIAEISRRLAAPR